MIVKKHSIQALCLTITALCPAGALFAADVVSVRQLASHSAAPSGIQVGSFIYSPVISLREMYTDNVYRTAMDEKSDLVTIFSPSMRISSDFDIHSVYLSGQGAFGFHKENESENYNDYSISAGGKLDLDYSTYFSSSLTHREAHETRDSLEDPEGDEPVRYSLSTLSAGFTRALGLIKLYLEAAVDRLRFEDSERDGVVIDNSGRDRDEYSAYAKLAYEYRSGYNLFVSNEYSVRRYESGNRDSTGHETKIGADVTISGKAIGEIYAGRLERNYEDELSDISTINYGASLLWNVTGITSITGSVERGIEETVLNRATGRVQTRFLLGMEHALQDNLFLLTDAGITLDEYEGGGSVDARVDETYTAGVAIEYTPIRGLDLNLGYDYAERKSEDLDDAYTNNRVYLSVTKRF